MWNLPFNSPWLTSWDNRMVFNEKSARGSGIADISRDIPKNIQTFMYQSSINFRRVNAIDRDNLLTTIDGLKVLVKWRSTSWDVKVRRDIKIQWFCKSNIEIVPWEYGERELCLESTVKGRGCGGFNSFLNSQDMSVESLLKQLNTISNDNTSIIH